MTDEEFILGNLAPTSWWSEFVHWLAGRRAASTPLLIALTDEDVP